MKDMIKSFMLAGCEVFENEPMSSHTTFRIGGHADFFVIPPDLETFCLCIKELKKRKIPFFILGKGSNVLFPDNGFKGIVISTEQLNNFKFNGNEVSAETGVSITKLAVEAMKRSLSGMEEFFGIPGTIGGALRMNSGAFGREISDIVEKVEIFDGQKRFWMFKEELNFGYRKSLIAEKNLWVVSALFKLKYSQVEIIREKMRNYMKLRIAKQPLNYPSAGSVFRRPANDIYVGKLVEDLGLKGLRHGDAMISDKHGGFIVNIGDARAEDVIFLINLIKQRVHENYGIELETEIELVENSLTELIEAQQG